MVYKRVGDFSADMITAPAPSNVNIPIPYYSTGEVTNLSFKYYNASYQELSAPLSTVAKRAAVAFIRIDLTVTVGGVSFSTSSGVAVKVKGSGLYG
jgi:hypothetical protein